MAGLLFIYKPASFADSLAMLSTQGNDSECNIGITSEYVNRIMRGDNVFKRPRIERNAQLSTRR